MPKRKAVHRVDSTAVQGEDSWVEVSSATLGEVLGARKAKEDGIEENVWERNLAYLKRHILSWNWVDVDGSPLPQPGTDPDVLLGLTLPEHSFLLDALFDEKSEEDEKN